MEVKGRLFLPPSHSRSDDGESSPFSLSADLPCRNDFSGGVKVDVNIAPKKIPLTGGQTRKFTLTPMAVEVIPAAAECFVRIASDWSRRMNDEIHLATHFGPACRHE
jgi:hypothetical protein